MKIGLMSLKLKNFKGIKSFELVTGGSNIAVRAENGVGKTTLYDAFTWLLFDKDSNGRSDFSIKTVDSNNDVIHGLDHEVSAVLLADGRELRLRKRYCEKWTKKRGESEKFLTGHETEYWADDVPCSKSQYGFKINCLVGDDVFKLITNPEYFAVTLEWKKRRELLLQIAGDVSDSDVIASNKQLAVLSELLNNRSIDDLRKMNAEQIKRHKKELENIRPRIDELSSSCLPAEEIAKKALYESDLGHYRKERDRVSVELASGESAESEERKVRREIATLEYVIKEKKQALKNDAQKAFNDSRFAYDLHQQKISQANQKLDLLRVDLANKTRDIDEADSTLTELRKEWILENDKAFIAPELTSTCFNCGQVLPDGMIDGQMSAMRNKFAEDKKAELAVLSDKGSRISDKKNDLKRRAEIVAKDIDSVTCDLEVIASEVVPAVTEFVEPDYESDLTVIEKVSELHKQSELLIKITSGTVDDGKDALLSEQRDINAKIDELTRLISTIDQTEKNISAINAYEEKERSISAEIMRLEGITFAIDQFVKAKVKLLEDSIDSRFKCTTFKMFKAQVNGGVEECCEPLINGVTYRDANLASRINAGLDIINTISAHYNAFAPIFIDRAESINNVIYTDAQTIKLVVSKDKHLTIELDSAITKEAI